MRKAAGKGGKTAQITCVTRVEPSLVYQYRKAKKGAKGFRSGYVLYKVRKRSRIVAEEDGTPAPGDDPVPHSDNGGGGSITPQKTVGKLPKDLTTRKGGR